MHTGKFGNMPIFKWEKLVIFMGVEEMPRRVSRFSSKRACQCFVSTSRERMLPERASIS
jgi:hypothetical protein